MKLNREFERLQRHIDKMTRHRETTVARNHKKVLDDLRFRLAKIYESYEINGQLTYAEMVKYNRLQKLDKEIEKMIKDLYKTNDSLIKGHLTAIAKETYNKTIDIIEEAADRKIKGVAKSFKVDKTVNEQMAGIQWPARMGKHRADVIWDIQKEIKQGLTQGDTYRTMAQRLKKELEVSNSKARTIIRTESARVHARAKEESLDAIAKEGVRMEKTWLSSQDERVRSTHADMNGVTVPYDDDFEMPGGYRAKGPMDARLPPGEVINCRCLITVDLAKDKPVDNIVDSGYNDTEEVDEELGKLLKSVEKIDTDNLSDRRGIAKDLLSDLDLKDLKISISKIDAHGQCEFSLAPDGKMDMQRFVLNSQDQRSESHSIKTLFHEAYHAKADGMLADIRLDRHAYLMIEDTFAETSAHYLYKQAGLEKEIAASYAEKLTEMLPRLKQLDKFKDCTTFADFGEIAWTDRLNGVNPKWKDLYNEAMKVDHDYNTFANKYINYIDKNKDDLLDVMLDNMPRYRNYKSAMANDLENAKGKLSGEIKGGLSSNEKMVLDNLITVSMGRLGVR